jgi:hypothetical protein
MRVRIKTWLPAAVGALAFFGLANTGAAQCVSGCQPPPPPHCCEPPPSPPPPPPPPPPTDCCDHPGPPDYPPPGGGINVNINVNANANSNASAASRAGINARVGGYGNLRGGGGGSAYVSVEQPYPTVIQGLTVEAGAVARVVRVPYEARRRWEKRVVIQAFCIDDRGSPHPASQVIPDRDIHDGYEGELYRRIAGTRLQITWAEWFGQVAFDHGESFYCQKGEALWRDRTGSLTCRPQTPQRECNERSLLRRYGAGVKVVTWIREEIYTEYREETVMEQGAAIVGATLMLDGGVGGRVF